MKKIMFIGLSLFLLSACALTPTPDPPMATFTPSPTALALNSTPLSTATVVIAEAEATSITGTPEPCKDEAQITSWLRDDVPYDYNDFNNNKPIPPNGRFTMTWIFENIGACVWDDTYKLAFESGIFFTQAQSYPILNAGQTIEPGQRVIVNISMVVPSKTGGYQATWRLQDGRGKSLLGLNVIAKVDRGSSKPPARPVNLKSAYTCKAGVADINLSWADMANNEDGYRLYRGGVTLLDLSANTSAYTDVVPGVGAYEYTIVAFNAAGEAPANISVNVTTCE